MSARFSNAALYGCKSPIKPVYVYSTHVNMYTGVAACSVSARTDEGNILKQPGEGKEV